MAPGDMQNVVTKARQAAAAAGKETDNFMLCDRGTSFGYNTLVSDMRGLSIMAETGCPVIFDATHSVQQPGGLGSRSGGQSQYVPLLARAAVAAASPVYSWRRTLIRLRRSRTARMRCRLRGSNPSCPNSWPSTRSPKMRCGPRCKGLPRMSLINKAKAIALAPIHVLQLGTSAKSFLDHPLIGAQRLNQMGLHRARVRFADAMCRWRRRRLAKHVRTTGAKHSIVTGSS